MAWRPLRRLSVFSPKVSATRPMARWAVCVWPSEATMPQLSWPAMLQGVEPEVGDVRRLVV